MATNAGLIIQNNRGITIVDSVHPTYRLLKKTPLSQLTCNLIAPSYSYNDPYTALEYAYDYDYSPARRRDCLTSAISSPWYEYVYQKQENTSLLAVGGAPSVWLAVNLALNNGELKRHQNSGSGYIDPAYYPGDRVFFLRCGINTRQNVNELGCSRIYLRAKTMSPYDKIIDDTQFYVYEFTATTDDIVQSGFGLQIFDGTANNNLIFDSNDKHLRILKSIRSNGIDQTIAGDSYYSNFSQAIMFPSNNTSNSAVLNNANNFWIQLTTIWSSSSTFDLTTQMSVRFEEAVEEFVYALPVEHELEKFWIDVTGL